MYIRIIGKNMFIFINPNISMNICMYHYLPYFITYTTYHVKYHQNSHYYVIIGVLTNLV